MKAYRTQAHEQIIVCKGAQLSNSSHYFRNTYYGTCLYDWKVPNEYEEYKFSKEGHNPLNTQSQSYNQTQTYLNRDWELSCVKRETDNLS